MSDRLPSSDYKAGVIGWVTAAAHEGRTFLENQDGYSEIDQLTDYIQGDQSAGSKATGGISNASLNHVGKISSDLVAALTDIKPFFSWRSHNDSMAKQADILNKLSESWWLNNFIDLKWAAAMQMAMPAGCAYLHLAYDPFASGGLGDMGLIPLDCRDVLPIRPASSMSIQDSMGVIIYSHETIYDLRQRYPQWADDLIPDKDFAFAPARVTRVSKLLTPVHDAVFKQRTASQMRTPGKEIFTCYLKDDSVNDSGAVIHMGAGPEDQPTSWSYEVAPGEPLYPRGRLIVCGNDLVLYDGPNIYWHGMFPLIKLPMDLSFVYPDSFLSKSPLSDLIPLQDALNQTVNGVLDAINKALEPGIVADKRAISKEALDALNPRRPGMKQRLNPVAGDGWQELDPPQLPHYVTEMVQFLIDRMEYVSGSVDMANLAKVRQLPSAESVEAIMQAMTPLSRLRGRIMEATMRELAEMLKYSFFQFYDMRRRVTILGRDGITLEDFDFDPNGMVPEGQENVDMPRFKRAKHHASNFSFFITPNSMLEMASVSKKVLYLQLRRMGEIDHQSFLEMMEVANIPEINKRLGEELEAKMQAVQGATAGRPGVKPSGQTMPRLEQKGDGRPVIAEN